MNKAIPLLLMSAALLSACKEEARPQEEIRPVRTITLATGTANSHAEFSGELHARQESALGFRIPGKLISRLVDIGAEVKTGTPLARIDAQDMVLNAAAAKAQTEAAQSQLDQLKLDLSRSQELLAKKFVSQADVDRRQTAVIAAQKQLVQAQSQQQVAQNQAGYTTLLATSDGVITATLAEPGQVLAAGQPVVQLAKAGETEVFIDLPEARSTDLKPGQKTEISFWALPGKTFNGKVREVSPAADPLSRTYRAKVSLENPSAEIRLGMSATVKSSQNSHTENATTLPLTAIYGKNKEQRVWLVENQRVKSKPIEAQIDAQHKNSEQVQVKGLKAGDVVVTAGVHLLREGQAVRLLPAQGE
ncbi:efflux RND transporter periplasmic adaptor subunit [Iodobacter sp. HSC-16F04]|uniref:Efflux RND transporter periplasmic adaptor subunit n=1 Tax=Iodobacter violaceini TaxID=3044271 RepID=A0ABX0KN67_9NEIS|nr:efflux RND transporter periplasmic adaptor subunit [Iodobacter violacea]NHQ85157.1 efflux RND transporter periplasmic adaptor subunit [Iodobacter violacea]